MKCYRIENFEGLGPFTYTVSERFRVMCNSAYIDGIHPTATFELDDDSHFAFPSISAIDTWFNDEMKNELHHNGYVINVYKVKGVTGQDAQQLQFRKESAKLIKTISL